MKDETARRGASRTMHLFVHRRSQDFVWGALFPAKKVDDLFLFIFLVVALKDRLKYTSKSNPPSTNCPKN